MIVAKTIYSRTGTPLLKKGTSLTRTYINKLLELGIPTIYIEENKVNMEGTGNNLDAKEELPDIISFETRLQAENVVKDLMNDCKMGRIINIKPIQEIVGRIIQEVIDTRKILVKLADIRILDDYTFAHCVNVSVLSISCGMIMGYNKTQLQDLGTGALLHDIGKIKIPLEVLNKPGKLSDTEYKQIMNHSNYGYEILKTYSDIKEISALVALQHHERYNGKGYPLGISNNNIIEYSKIVALADVYDALTADRVYKNAVLPYEAIEVIIASGGFHFDPNLVKTFVENISVYPIGSIVELNDGKIGLVVNVNRNLPHRPVLRILKNEDGHSNSHYKEIDLMVNNTLFVNKIISFKSMNIN